MAVVAPFTARAQEPGRVYHLGWLVPTAQPGRLYFTVFADELRRSGFVEGQNLQVDFRAPVPPDQAREIAQAVVAAGVDAIFTSGNQLIRSVQEATRTVPLVVIADDLVLSGLVRSLAHPGGNTTGISILATELDGKRQQLLAELVPGVHRIAALVEDGVTAPEQLHALEAAAHARGVELSVSRVTKAAELVPAIDRAHAAGVEALNVLASTLFSVNQKLIIDRAAVLKLPAIYQWPEEAEAGGLAAYGPRQSAMARQNARQLVKILRGAKPADIPVEQPDKFELVINLKTAKALGLTIPEAMLDRADKLIE
jgi:putative ABC transport system substrate-binding protein